MWLISLSIIFSNLGKHKNVNIANFVHYGKTRMQSHSMLTTPQLVILYASLWVYITSHWHSPCILSSSISRLILILPAFLLLNIAFITSPISVVPPNLHSQMYLVPSVTNFCETYNSMSLSSTPILLFLPPAYVVWREGTVFTGVCLLTFRGGPGLRFGGVLVSGSGGSPVSGLMGGTSLRLGGYWSQVWGGPGLRFRGGTWSQVWGGSLCKGKKILTPDLAWYMFRLEKKFSHRDPPPPVKGKNFDTRFGLIHVQTGKKNFADGPPPEYQALAMAMQRVVCLLHSRRRTVLLSFFLRTPCKNKTHFSMLIIRSNLIGINCITRMSCVLFDQFLSIPFCKSWVVLVLLRLWFE